MERDGPPARPHVAVVGGGVAGLTAARELTSRLGDRIDVTVLEGAPLVGGKLRVSEVAGIPVDEGAESMLARRPEGVELAKSLGLGDDLVEPGTTRAAIWAGGALRPMPSGHVMGVPADAAAVAVTGLLSAESVARIEAEDRLPPDPLDGDVAVGPYVAARLGGEVVDRLVEPLLGGVYAGRADELSLRATLPQLVPGLQETGSLVGAARAVTARAPVSAGPVFTSVRGGMGRLAAVLAERCGARVRTSAMVRELRRTQSGWALTVGPTRAPEQVLADAVVVAVPARPASRLLADAVPAAARELAAIEYASMVLVTFAFPAVAFPAPPAGSGYLVPASEGRLTKAATFITTKWPHAARDGLVVVRCSLGRHGDERRLQEDDETLARRAATELADAVGVRGEPVDVRVSRWGGALPQYAVGHLDRVDRVTAALAAEPTLAVCGAAYRGVGVPACIGTAREAADRVAAALGRT
jgi:protoporphyrinogen/coproporphyrinogen III oxidase